MTRRLSLLLALGCTALPGCDRSGGQANVAAEPAPAPIVKAPPEPKASIMRPSVVEEVVPAPPPPPEPVKETVHFAAGEAVLSEEAMAELDRLVEPINALAGPVTIRGHTDSKGNDDDNRRMSERRAGAVRDYLAAHGVAAERMTTIGLGEDRPVAPNATLDGQDDEAGRQKNRRVVIVAEPAKAAEAAPRDDGEPEPRNSAAADQE